MAILLLKEALAFLTSSTSTSGTTVAILFYAMSVASLLECVLITFVTATCGTLRH